MPSAGGVSLALRWSWQRHNRLGFCPPASGDASNPSSAAGAGGRAAGPSAAPLAPVPTMEPGGTCYPEDVGSVDRGGAAAGRDSRKRTLDELKDAVEELSERQSLEEGLGQPGGKDPTSTPMARRLMNYVSKPDMGRFYVFLFDAHGRPTTVHDLWLVAQFPI